jgi:8-hydroxy-5-deazaflavin:NADPH oxidoreductase
MRIGIIGSGHIGSNIGRRAAEGDHEVTFAFSRDPTSLERLAADVGHGAKWGCTSEASASDLVILAVPWNLIDKALSEAGSLKGKIVVDTTNPYGASGLIAFADGVATGERNQRKIPGARIVKAFNTYTASFQAAARNNPAQIAMFISGVDMEAKQIVSGLVHAVGFEPVDLGGWKTAMLLDAPRRDGAVYGEAYTPSDARKIADLAARDIAAAMHLATKLKM